MKATLIPVDSAVLGGNVLSIDDFSALEDFAAFERAYQDLHNPVYVTVKVPLERLAEVHALETQGFRLIECQIRSRIDLTHAYDIQGYPYRFAQVVTQEELEGVLDIAQSTFEHDRFSMDPLLGRALSGQRYARYVWRSFQQPDEAVYRLFDPKGGRTVAFKTHRLLAGGEALLLLGGVHPDFRRLGLGVVNDYAELNRLRDLGVRRAYTHISAGNYPVFNMEIGNLGFRVLTTFAVLRKAYSATGQP